jgi:hypothetical protein
LDVFSQIILSLKSSGLKKQNKAKQTNKKLFQEFSHHPIFASGLSFPERRA